MPYSESKSLATEAISEFLYLNERSEVYSYGRDIRELFWPYFYVADAVATRLRCWITSSFSEKKLVSFKSISTRLKV